jgi:predicted nucleic acid-binding protein
MRIVVADTGPLNYLILIGAIELLPRLFESVLIPETVRTELRHPGASPLVRIWADQPPAWMQVQAAPALAMTDPMLRALDDGEAAAIALAHQVGAGLILMDDRAGVAIAQQQGFAVTGTLGVFDRAARHGLINLAAAFDRLKATSFRYRSDMLDALLAEHTKRGQG